jgi:hypothetical protein
MSVVWCVTAGASIWSAASKIPPTITERQSYAVKKIFVFFILIFLNDDD